MAPLPGAGAFRVSGESSWHSLSRPSRVEIADLICKFALSHRLVGLVVTAFVSKAEDSGFDPACAGIFAGSSHTSDLNIGDPVATLRLAL